jgi:hypothetical protein
MKGLPPSWQPSTVDTACSTYFGITCVSNVAVPGYAGTFDRVKCVVAKKDAHSLLRAPIRLKKQMLSINRTIIFPTCDNVTRINGTLPENIGLLTELREIEIDACDMGGQIPNSLFMLPKISTVRLQENFFTGSLPEHLSESITELFVRYFLFIKRFVIFGRLFDRLIGHCPPQKPLSQHANRIHSDLLWKAQRSPDIVCFSLPNDLFCSFAFEHLA